MLYTNAMRLGLLAEPSTAEQMEKLLDGLLAPDERMIRGPNGMEPLDWLQETEPDALLLDAAHGGMELGARIRGESRAAGSENQHSAAGAHRRRPDEREPGPGIQAEARAGAEPVHGINTSVYAIEGRVL